MINKNSNAGTAADSSTAADVTSSQTIAKPNAGCCGGNRCSDFDDDCVFVKDHLACFVGLVTGIADGYCPFIHHSN